MVFNSYEFIFGFCPIVFGVFFVLRRYSVQAALSWLAIASLFFYGYWSPKYLILIIASMMGNFYLGKLLTHPVRNQEPGRRKALLVFAVSLNIFVLSYYKYTGFVFSTLIALGLPLSQIGTIILPLGISFFTFLQISYIVDAYYGKAESVSFRDYVFFVSFFPHLIAGPIVRHDEFLPQLKRPEARFDWQSLALGLTVFAMGLAKKTVIADSLAPIANAFFDGKISSFTRFETCRGIVAYSLQIYFDFSGYSDMAIGLARMVGIRFPLNFNSPYQATSIIDFWHRWHITLSRFLRDYLYIPLGGNRKGKFRRYANLWLTMAIGGLWHGAGWNFIIWGCLHGSYLIVNHAWNHFFHTSTRVFHWWQRPLTLATVFFAWIFFRSKDLNTSLAVVRAIAFSNPGAAHSPDYSYNNGMVLAALLLSVLTPNVATLVSRFQVILDTQAVKTPRITWSPRFGWALLTGLALVAGVCFIHRSQVFLYYQF